MLNAWKIIEKFNGLTGLKLNEEKSGSAIINLSKLDSKSSITQTPGPTPLPQGTVRWVRSKKINFVYLLFTGILVFLI